MLVIAQHESGMIEDIDPRGRIWIRFDDNEAEWFDAGDLCLMQKGGSIASDSEVAMPRGSRPK